MGACVGTVGSLCTAPETITTLYNGLCVCSIAKSCLTLATPWTVASQAPLSMGFSRQEYWSGLPFPLPGDLPDPGIEPVSPAAPALETLSLNYRTGREVQANIIYESHFSAGQIWESDEVTCPELHLCELLGDYTVEQAWHDFCLQKAHCLLVETK